MSALDATEDQAREGRAEHGGDRALRRDERRRLALLGLPTFGLALAITVVSTYLPTVARHFTTSNTLIGVLIGGEGVGALVLPVLVGSWSDGLRTRLGGRLPFVLAGTPIAILGLVLMALVGSLAAAGLAVALFFVGYFVAYEPYRALYPDLVPDEAAGRAQSTQAVWRGAGTGVALLAGGLLLALGQAVPFVAAAAVLLLACGAFVLLSARRGVSRKESQSGRTVRESVRDLVGLLLHDGALRAFFVANALWELALAALKTFVILWLTRGLHLSLSGSALIVGAVALVVLVGAAASGKLADRLGRRRVMLVAVLAFGLFQLVPLLTTSRPLIVASIPFVALGGGVLLSLPYALLIPLMPPDRHGALTGFYSASRGVGVMLGPLLGGVAVSALAGPLASTEGYAAFWGVCAVASLASVPLLLQVRGERAS